MGVSYYRLFYQNKNRKSSESFLPYTAKGQTDTKDRQTGKGALLSMLQIRGTQQRGVVLVSLPPCSLAHRCSHFPSLTPPFSPLRMHFYTLLKPLKLLAFYPQKNNRKSFLFFVKIKQIYNVSQKSFTIISDYYPT